MRARGVWWISPVGAVCLMSLPTLYLAAHTSDAEYRSLWGAPKALTAGTVILVLCGIAVFAIAASLPMLSPAAEAERPWPNLDKAQLRLLDRAAQVLFWLTMGGYLAFAFSAYRNNLRLGTFVQALLGQDVGGLKDSLSHITGVTSLTQIGIAFVVVGTLVALKRPSRRVIGQLSVVVLLGLLRADLLSERLAVLELAVPIATVLALRFVAVGTRRARRLIAWAPAVFVPLVFVVFGAFEYSRSWVFFRSRTSASFPQFVAERLGGYYATAYNNGQLELNYISAAGRVPYDTVEALWTAPGASLYGGYPLHGGLDPSTAYGNVLLLHGNPEFNSPGGLVLPFVDWGTAGGFVYLAVIGILLGLLYRGCIAGRPFSVVVFPSVVTGLFELPRYIYWSLGRYTPGLVALCVVGILVHRRRSAPARVPNPSPVAAGVA